MEECHRRVGRVGPEYQSSRRGRDKQRCDREVAVDMLPCCRRGAGVAGAARRDHDGYSDTPGRPVLPDGGNSSTSRSR